MTSLQQHFDSMFAKRNKIHILVYILYRHCACACKEGNTHKNLCLFQLWEETEADNRRLMQEMSRVRGQLQDTKYQMEGVSRKVSLLRITLLLLLLLCGQLCNVLISLINIDQPLLQHCDPEISSNVFIFVPGLLSHCPR